MCACVKLPELLRILERKLSVTLNASIDKHDKGGLL